MFKHITINLKYPICGCYQIPSQNNTDYYWSLVTTFKGINLRVSCKTCNTFLEIPSKEFRATFNIEQLPKTLPKEVSKNILKSIKPKKIPFYLRIIK